MGPLFVVWAQSGFRDRPFRPIEWACDIVGSFRTSRDQNFADELFSIGVDMSTKATTQVSNCLRDIQVEMDKIVAAYQAAFAADPQFDLVRLKGLRTSLTRIGTAAALGVELIEAELGKSASSDIRKR